MPASEDNYALLRRQLRAKNPAKLYVFYGAESYLREHYITQLTALLVEKDLEAFNLHRLEGKQLTLSALQNAVDAHPLMAERRLVVVTDLDVSRLPAGEQEAWAEFFAHLPDHCCLIVNHDLLPYKPDKRSAASAALEKHALTVSFESPDEAGLCSWLVRHAAALGKNIDNRACRRLIFLTGGSMLLMKGEIEKLCAYVRQNAVTVEDVDLLVVPVPDAAAFTLAEQAASGDIAAAARTLRSLQAMREPPEMLLGAVSKTMRGVYAAALALQSRKSMPDVMALMGYRSLYPVKKLFGAASRRDIGWCRHALQSCMRADEMLKRGAYADRERVMEWLLARLA